mmetsp:Transcript_56452/g.99164  ORF Transcript_56452/g.99164 Transcript_56452/m.99164 type:complete len:256 (+) Transcript_56452:1330-2097(+)
MLQMGTLADAFIVAQAVALELQDNRAHTHRRGSSGHRAVHTVRAEPSGARSTSACVAHLENRRLVGVKLQNPFAVERATSGATLERKSRGDGFIRQNLTTLFYAEETITVLAEVSSPQGAAIDTLGIQNPIQSGIICTVAHRRRNGHLAPLVRHGDRTSVAEGQGPCARFVVDSIKNDLFRRQKVNLRAQRVTMKRWCGANHHAFTHLGDCGKTSFVHGTPSGHFMQTERRHSFGCCFLLEKLRRRFLGPGKQIR